ncbi:putative protein BRICK1-B [Styela clava]
MSLYEENISNETKESRHQRIQEDWDNREYVEAVTSSIRKMTTFLNLFDASCRNRLTFLNQKLSSLERKIDYIEARIEKKAT